MNWLRLLARLGNFILDVLNARGEFARREQDTRAREAESYRETTKRMQDADPSDSDTDAVRARLRKRPRDTR